MMSAEDETQPGGRAKGSAAAAAAASDPNSNNNGNNNNRIRRRGQRLKAGFAKVGSALQKVNLAKLIDDMEHDQEVADNLEVVNQEIKEESDRKALVREATELCHAEIRNHLDEFLQEHPDARYEDWIEDVHPDNVTEGKLFTDMKQVDLRFYVESSDHRILWNSVVDDTDRHVPARTYQLPPSTQRDGSGEEGAGAGGGGGGASSGPVDLLG